MEEKFYEKLWFIVLMWILFFPIGIYFSWRKDKGLFSRDWFIYLMLILFAPVGIYLIWKKRKFIKPVRIIISLIALMLFLNVYGGYTRSINTQNDVDSQIATKQTTNIEDANKKEPESIEKESDADASISSPGETTDNSSEVSSTSTTESIPAPEPTPVPAPQPIPVQEPASSGNIVYANGGHSKSNKYHSSPTAHNMEGAIEMTEEEAQSQGYVPCKRCY